MEKLISPDQLAKGWGISKATLYGWRYAGKGPPAIRLGKHLRYRPSDVEAWLQEQAKEAAATRQRV
jgi:predicted DNA-binding transcriptional regulator AlpA